MRVHARWCFGIRLGIVVALGPLPLLGQAGRTTVIVGTGDATTGQFLRGVETGHGPDISFIDLSSIGGIEYYSPSEIPVQYRHQGLSHVSHGVEARAWPRPGQRNHSVMRRDAHLDAAVRDRRSSLR